MSDPASPNKPTSLWAAVGGEALAEIAASRRRQWPRRLALDATRDRSIAVTNARDLARREGAGHVVELVLPAERFARIDDQPLVPTELEGVLTAPIMENAHYRGTVDDTDLARAEKMMGLRFPPPWRAYLLRDVWFHRGWMSTSGEYVWLYDPSATAGVWDVWDHLKLEDRPGMLAIGCDGGSLLITLDARDPRSRVTCTDSVSQGWQDSVMQTGSIEAFVDEIESGVFAYRFDD